MPSPYEHHLLIALRARQQTEALALTLLLAEAGYGGRRRATRTDWRRARRIVAYRAARLRRQWRVVLRALFVMTSGRLSERG